MPVRNQVKAGKLVSPIVRSPKAPVFAKPPSNPWPTSPRGKRRRAKMAGK